MSWMAHSDGNGARGAVGLALTLLLGGCSTTIVPPAAPAGPTPVFLLDHGRHATLVLPHPRGVVRYAYGDWAWYAQVDTGALEASRAVLWPSPAAFGRRVMQAPATAEGVRRHLRVGVEQLYALEVAQERVATLRADLEALFFAGRDKAMENAAYDLTFVPHPQRYSAAGNSNHKVAEWLQRLGCTVRGSAFWSDWQVVEAE